MLKQKQSTPSIDSKELEGSIEYNDNTSQIVLIWSRNSLYKYLETFGLDWESDDLARKYFPEDKEQWRRYMNRLEELGFTKLRSFIYQYPASENDTNLGHEPLVILGFMRGHCFIPFFVGNVEYRDIPFSWRLANWFENLGRLARTGYLM